MTTKKVPNSIRSVSILMALTLLFAGNITFAQEKKPAELQEFFNLVEEETAPVTTGVSRPLMQEDVPASITVITAEELKLLGLRNLTDVINLIVPGAVGDIHRSSRTGLFAFRGITVDNNGKFVFMVDGLNVGELSQWGAFNERFLGLMDELDRIEIIQGTGSILYGSGAISGIINFITKTGNTFQGTEVTAGYGSWDKKETSLKLGKKAANPDEWTYFLYGGYKKSDGSVPRGGDLNSQTESSGTGRHWDRFDNSGKFHANLTKGDFSLHMRYVRDRFEEPYVAAGQTLNTSDAFWFEDYMFIQPEYSYKIDDVSSLKANCSFVMNQTGMIKNHDWVRGSTLVIEDNHNQNTAGERKFRSQLFHYYDGFANHKLTSGLEFFWMYAGPDFGNEDYSIRYSGGNKIMEPKIWDKETFNFFAFFAEDMWKLSEKTTLFAGGRVEDHSLTPVNFSPRIAVSYDHDEKTNFKLLYNRGFRTPDWVYYDVNKRTAGAVEPKPEKVDSFEGHIIHKFNPKFTLTTIAYYTIYNDLINYYTGHGYYNYPGTVKAAGVEVSGDYKTDNLRLIVSHSYSKPISIPQNNFTIVNLSYDNENWAQFPTNMTKAHAIINLVKDKWLLGITYFRPWGIKGQKNASDSLKTSADYVNATLTYKVNKNFEMQFSGYNLTGEDHPWWGASTQNGISRSVDPHTEWFARMIWRF